MSNILIDIHDITEGTGGLNTVAGARIRIAGEPVFSVFPSAGPHVPPGLLLYPPDERPSGEHTYIHAYFISISAETDIFI